jgi:glycosyltransferase involved in cell wall biosynthesis
VGIATELGVAHRVEFRERARDELRQEYLDADVLLFPPTWEEPFGLAPVEAMACGVPVVATGTGGSAEFLVDGHNAVLVPKRDEHALAAAVRRIADDDALQRRLADGGFATARELTVDALADCLEQWYIAAARRFEHGRPPDRPALTVGGTAPR